MASNMAMSTKLMTKLHHIYYPGNNLKTLLPYNQPTSPKIFFLLTDDASILEIIWDKLL